MNEITIAKAESKEVEGKAAARDLRTPAALVRTALSSEQTLMSWVRTSLSLCTFGFALAKFFQYLATDSNPDVSLAPRRLGMVLILVGVVVLIIAVVEHLFRIRDLKQLGLPADAGSLLPLGSASAMLAIGLAALVSVFLRWQL